MTEIRHLALAAALAALAVPAVAAPLDGYSSFYVFGDSLSDPGNLPAGYAPPSPPYYSDGDANPSGVGLMPAGASVQFSDGPVWAELVGATGNFAFGGARATGGGALPPDFASQISLFEGYVGGATGTSDLAAVWFGANDLFAAIRDAAGAASLAEATAIIGGAAFNAAQAIGDGIERLAADGFETFAVFNLPALELTPAFLDDPDTIEDDLRSFAAQAATDAFNQFLALEIASLGALDVVSIDVDALFSDVRQNSEAFGITNVDDPCVVFGDGVFSVCADPASYLFFDAVHPSSTAHAAIAEAFTDALGRPVAPVPLPAGLPLLLAGVGGLALVRRRVAR